MLEPKELDPAGLVKERTYHPDLKNKFARQAWSAILFQDGKFQQAFSNDPNGLLPAASACIFWGVPCQNSGKKDRDMARAKDLKGIVRAEYFDPPLGSGGSAGWTIYTPEEGHTLLEVFLLTSAGFNLEQAKVR